MVMQQWAQSHQRMTVLGSTLAFTQTTVTCLFVIRYRQWKWTFHALETTGIQIIHQIPFPSQAALANVCLVYQTTVAEDTELHFFMLQKIATFILFKRHCGDYNAFTAEPYITNGIFSFVVRSIDNGDGMLSLLKQTAVGLVSDVWMSEH